MSRERALRRQHDPGIEGTFIGEWGRGGPEPWLRSREQSKFRANAQGIGWLAV